MDSFFGGSPRAKLKMKNFRLYNCSRKGRDCGEIHRK
jgi:hypothetical protein